MACPTEQIWEKERIYQAFRMLTERKIPYCKKRKRGKTLKKKMAEQQTEKKKPKKWKKFVVVAAIAACFCAIPALASPDDDDENADEGDMSETEWKSWDDEKKDEAWTVFTTSEWNSMNIYFGASGNIAKADIPDEQIAIFKPLFQKVLNDDNVDGIYSAEEYLPLLLAIGNQLYLEQIGFGSMPDKEGDIFGVNKYIYTTEQVEIKTPEQSAKYLVKRLIQCEKKLRTDGRDPEDLYQVNGCLKSLIQGIIYGPEYCGENYEYTSDNAKVYFDNHKDQMLFSDLDGKASFAENVAKNYTAIKVTVADE